MLNLLLVFWSPEVQAGLQNVKPGLSAAPKN